MALYGSTCQPRASYDSLAIIIFKIALIYFDAILII
jgi:hypothetical protein